MLGKGHRLLINPDCAFEELWILIVAANLHGALATNLMAHEVVVKLAIIRVHHSLRNHQILLRLLALELALELLLLHLRLVTIVLLILGLLEYLLMVLNIDLVHWGINLALVPLHIIDGQILPMLILLRPNGLVRFLIWLLFNRGLSSVLDLDFVVQDLNELLLL